MIPSVYYLKSNGTDSCANSVSDLRFLVKEGDINPTTEVYERTFLGAKGESWAADAFIKRFGPEYDRQIRAIVGIIGGLTVAACLVAFFPGESDLTSKTSREPAETIQASDLTKRRNELRIEYLETKKERKEIEEIFQTIRNSGNQQEIAIMRTRMENVIARMESLNAKMIELRATQ